MKKIWILSLMTAALTFSFANGRNDTSFGPGSWDEREIVTVEGTLEEGDYGHLEIASEGKHFLLGTEDFYPEELLNQLLGAELVLEGFEGPVMFTKNKVEYLSFHPLKVVADGEELDLSELGIGMMGGFGGPMGGRGGRNSGMRGGAFNCPDCDNDGFSRNSFRGRGQGRNFQDDSIQ